MSGFVPAGAAVPNGLETAAFRLRMLTVNDLIKDYDAVISSAARLRGVFGPGSDWPRGLTLEQDLIDLGWHQKEFQRGSSFTYAAMTPDETRCLGCVYVYPSEKIRYDAKVILWARGGADDHAADALDAGLEAAVRGWLAERWWFASPGFPGREPSWNDWLALPDR